MNMHQNIKSVQKLADSIESYYNKFCNMDDYFRKQDQEEHG